MPLSLVIRQKLANHVDGLFKDILLVVVVLFTDHHDATPLVKQWLLPYCVLLYLTRVKYV